MDVLDIFQVDGWSVENLGQGCFQIGKAQSDMVVVINPENHQIGWFVTLEKLSIHDQVQSVLSSHRLSPEEFESQLHVAKSDLSMCIKREYRESLGIYSSFEAIVHFIVNNSTKPLVVLSYFNDSASGVTYYLAVQDEFETVLKLVADTQKTTSGSKPNNRHVTNSALLKHLGTNGARDLKILFANQVDCSSISYKPTDPISGFLERLMHPCGSHVMCLKCNQWVPYGFALHNQPMQLQNAAKAMKRHRCKN